MQTHRNPTIIEKTALDNGTPVWRFSHPMLPDDFLVLPSVPSVPAPRLNICADLDTFCAAWLAAGPALAEDLHQALADCPEVGPSKAELLINAWTSWVSGESPVYVPGFTSAWLGAKATAEINEDGRIRVSHPALPSDLLIAMEDPADLDPIGVASYAAARVFIEGRLFRDITAALREGLGIAEHHAESIVEAWDELASGRVPAFPVEPVTGHA